LTAAIESALAQDYPHLEVVVIDDGSNDGTAGVIRSFGDRVRSARQPNAGLANARNAGCRLARGELIALMDADDLCLPERITRQVQVLERFPEIVLCGSDFSAFTDHGEVSSSFGAEYYSELSDASGGLTSKYKLRARLPSIRYNSDWECFVRLARIGPFAHIRSALLAYRLSAAQMSSSVGNRGRGAADLVRTFEKVCRADSDLIRDQPDRVRTCWRQFCTDAARALVESDRTEAANMLWQSAVHGGIDGDWLRILCKLAVPGSLLRVARQLRSR
jgi:glycosyltransferase involved in cell wall biosynthesis